MKIIIIIIVIITVMRVINKNVNDESDHNKQKHLPSSKPSFTNPQVDKWEHCNHASLMTVLFTGWKMKGCKRLNPHRRGILILCTNSLVLLYSQVSHNHYIFLAILPVYFNLIIPFLSYLLCLLKCPYFFKGNYKK